jgi:flavodoxin
MNALVVHFSKFGHTQKIANAVADTLADRVDVKTISSDQLTTGQLKEADLVVMGTPTHNMNLPKAVQPVFEKLPKKVLPGTPVAAFDTSYKMSAILARFTAAKRLARMLRKLGGKLILSPETFYVKEREGPLYDGELERAKDWGGKILEQFQT